MKFSDRARLALFLFLGWFVMIGTCAVLEARQEAKTEMADMDIPSQYGTWIFLRGVDTSDLTKLPLPDDVDGANLYLIGYDTVRNRLHVFEKSGDHVEIPSFNTYVLDMYGTTFLPIINEQGGFDTTLDETTSPNPLVDFATPGASGIRWPQGEAMEGAAWVVDAAVDELARDGVETVVRHRMGWHKIGADWCEQSSVNMNIGTKTQLFTPNGSQKWVIDHVVIRKASVNLNTADFSFGTDAGASNWKATRVYSELTTDAKVTVVHPDPGAEVATASNPFGVKCNVTQGAAATVQMEVFAYRVE